MGGGRRWGGVVWLLRRLIASVAIVFAVVTLVFILIHLAPGDPCAVNDTETSDPIVCAQLVKQFGLGQPLPEQYGRYLVQVVVHGNLGYSFSLHRPVRDALAETIPFTLELGGVALLLDFVVGLWLGIYQALRVNRLSDVVLSNVTLFVYSLPTFWLALVLLLLFAEKIKIFPLGGPSDPILCP